MGGMDDQPSPPRQPTRQPVLHPVAAVARLDAALDDVFDVDVHDLDNDEVHDSVIALQHANNKLVAASSLFVYEWDVRKLWADDGSKSPAARLCRETGIASHTARLAVRRARQLSSMPATATALAAGEICPDHVDLLATANANDWPEASFADSEPMLVGFCTSMRFDHARRAIDYWKQRADPDDTEHRGEQLHASRKLAAATTIDGVVALNGILDPIGGAAFINELHRIEHRMSDDDRRTGNVRTSDQRRADALVEMAHQSRTARPGGLRPRPLITVLVGETTFTRVCELANGHVIAPGQIVPWLDDADIERIIFDSPDRIMSVSHKRTFTGALRRAIEVRDRHCTHPAGCNTPAEHCDVDHHIPHSHGGITDQHNGRLRCPTHNRNPTKRNQRPRNGPTTIDDDDEDDDDDP